MKLFSALKKQGIDEVSQLLFNWTHPDEAEAAPAPVVEAEVPAEDESEDQ